MARWMINCKQYAELVSGCMDRQLTFWESLSMKLHALLCPPCHLVHKQLEIMRTACRLVDSHSTGAHTSAICLTDEAKQRIKAALSKVSR